MPKLDLDLYVPLDVGFYDDERVIEAGPEAAQLYTWGLTFAKARRTDGRLARGHLRRYPYGNPSDLSALVAGPVAQLVSTRLWDYDSDGSYHIANWFKWNPSEEELTEERNAKSAGGVKGAHRRFHTEEVSPGCPICESEGPYRTTHKVAMPKRREEKRREHIDVQTPSAPAREPFESDFAEVWDLYPQKLGRKVAMGKYIATRRKGATKDELLTATKNYVAYCRTEGTEVRYVKHGATFFGPGEHWRDFLTAPKRQPGPGAVTFAKPFVPAIDQEEEF